MADESSHQPAPGDDASAGGEAAPTLTLTFVAGSFAGQTRVLQPGAPASIGRLRECDIVCDARVDLAVSDRHARLDSDGVDWWIEELASSAGTLVNDRALTGRRRLAPGDLVELGRRAGGQSTGHVSFQVALGGSVADTSSPPTPSVAPFAGGAKPSARVGNIVGATPPPLDPDPEPRAGWNPLRGLKKRFDSFQERRDLQQRLVELEQTEMRRARASADGAAMALGRAAWKQAEPEVEEWRSAEALVANRERKADLESKIAADRDELAAVEAELAATLAALDAESRPVRDEHAAAVARSGECDTGLAQARESVADLVQERVEPLRELAGRLAELDRRSSAPADDVAEVLDDLAGTLAAEAKAIGGSRKRLAKALSERTAATTTAAEAAERLRTAAAAMAAADAVRGEREAEDRAGMGEIEGRLAQHGRTLEAIEYKSAPHYRALGGEIVAADALPTSLTELAELVEARRTAEALRDVEAQRAELRARLERLEG